MEQEEIIKGNKLIAEFMDEGGEPNYYNFSFTKDQFRTGLHHKQTAKLIFHDSWNWLMPVVEKIAQHYDVRITWMPTAIDVTYIDRPDTEDDEVTSHGGDTAFNNTYKCVVRFIEWHNEKLIKKIPPTT